MSQHYMTVLDAADNRNRLTTGWDRMLSGFFLELEDAAGNMLCDTWCGTIGQIEDKLRENNIPFVPSDENGSCVNPRLLPLLSHLLREKDAPQQQQRANLARHWDTELPMRYSEYDSKDDIIAEFDRHYTKVYSYQNQHPVYSFENYEQWIVETDELPTDIPYWMWAAQNLVDLARRNALAD